MLCTSPHQLFTVEKEIFISGHDHITEFTVAQP
jgi:hypothetical protein